MDEEVRRVYLDELMLRCDICHAAMKELNDISAEDPMCRDPFRPALEFVYQAAGISKLLWPPHSKGKEAANRSRRRGEQLRVLLGVGDDHPIRGRTLRDHIEHYDERLDAWADEARGHHVMHRLVGPLSVNEGVGRPFIVQHYDPATRKLGFRGEYFDIGALDAAIEDVYVRAKRARRRRNGV